MILCLDDLWKLFKMWLEALWRKGWQQVKRTAIGKKGIKLYIIYYILYIK